MSGDEWMNSPDLKQANLKSYWKEVSASLWSLRGLSFLSLCQGEKSEKPDWRSFSMPGRQILNHSSTKPWWHFRLELLHNSWLQQNRVDCCLGYLIRAEVLWSAAFTGDKPWLKCQCRCWLSAPQHKCHILIFDLLLICNVTKSLFLHLFRNIQEVFYYY